ncbi:MAG: hypothetical protein M1820_001172 [Bogoriella megaspora]|nr:MAG: hypothetical protein M1820_001172 [Bogoriella megaspora]
MASSQFLKPTIVFFPGAFASPSCFDNLAKQLHSAEYSTHYVHTPSLSPSCPPEYATVERDAEITRRDHLFPLIKDQERDVIIFAHSYGGIVAGGAAHGLSKDKRAKAGKRGGVIGLLYCSGNITLEGESLLQTPSEGLAIISPVKDILYNDCDPKLLPSLEAGMIPHSMTAFETPAPEPAWGEKCYQGKRSYVMTLKDACNPKTLQDEWISKTRVDWRIYEFETGHCPFISKVEELAKAVVNFAELCG